jgi:hypothetical protein
VALGALQPERQLQAELQVPFLAVQALARPPEQWQAVRPERQPVLEEPHRVALRAAGQLERERFLEELSPEAQEQRQEEEQLVPPEPG